MKTPNLSHSIFLAGYHALTGRAKLLNFFTTINGVEAVIRTIDGGEYIITIKKLPGIPVKQKRWRIPVWAKG